VSRPSPGYRDAHTHLSAGACDLLDLDLRDVTGPGDAAARIARADAERPRGSWIRGWGFSGGEVPFSALPGDRPVFVARRDGHAAWLSPAAFVRLGVPAPPGGCVAEEAFEDARRRLPPPSESEREAAIEARLRELVGLGFEEVDDIVEAWGPAVWTRLDDRGAIPVRVGLWLPDTTSNGEAEAVRRAIGDGRPSLAVRGVKVYLDGTLGARTAALAADYADAPGSAGTLRLSPAELHDRVRRWASAGWPVAIHALGDRAVTLALDALERAARPAWGGHRIEHAQVVSRADLPRFRAAGVIASLQPGHWRDDRSWLGARLGSRPGIVAHPLRSLVRSGATVVFGSDWPVSTWEPEAILSAACDALRGDERLTREEALGSLRA
jgi:predicted amidohydrolase YtcJ